MIDIDPDDLPPIYPVWTGPGEIDVQSLSDCIVFEMLSMDYPDVSERDIAYFVRDGEDDHQITDELLYDELKFAASELLDLTDEALNNQYKHKCFSAGRSAIHALDGDTEGWIFTQPKAKADFTFWSRMTYWNVEEVVALSLGRDPRLVNEESIKQIYRWETLPFPNEYLKRKDLIGRAFEFEDLPERFRPKAFVEWARKIDLEIPKELEEELEQLEMPSSPLWDQFDEESETYPPELHVAVRAWRAVHHQTDSVETPKERIRNWVRKYFSDLSKESVERIAVVCNWDRRGGRKKKE